MPEEDDNLGEMLGVVLRVAVRRRWWVIVPAFAVAMATCLTAVLLPRRYESVAIILVERQQVPERYVTPNSTSDIQEALQGMEEAVLSRTQLLQIIDEFGLYPKTRSRLAPEELVKLMRADIKIGPNEKGSDSGNKPLNAFKVSFTCNDAHVAQAVTSRFTTLFIEENLRSREEQSTGTTNFLTDQLTTATADLRRQESRVRDFKMRNLGELPEQQQGNLQILSGLHMQLQQTMAAASHAREQQAYLETLLSHYRDMPSATETKSASPTSAPTAVEAMQTELTHLRSQRADLLARYTPKYPDVQKLDDEIAQDEAQLARLSAAAEHATDQSAGQNADAGGTSGRETTVAQLRSQLEANRIEIQNAVAEQKNLEDRIADYQRRLNMTPVREQELADMLRDYSLSKQNYDDLLGKKTQSLLATSLEKHQQGQQFRIIDAPNLPIKPTSPNVVQICLLGLAAGLAAGAGLAYLAEFRDHSIRDYKEVRKQLGFPLVIALPLMFSPSEEQARAKTKMLEWVAGGALALIVCVTELIVLRHG